MIALKSAHIHLEHELVEKVFGNIQYAYTVYDPDLKLLLITSVSSQWFVKVYEKPLQFLLKLRNPKGDKTLAVREILIDNDIDCSDRVLDFELIEKTNLLKIAL